MSIVLRTLLIVAFLAGAGVTPAFAMQCSPLQPQQIHEQSETIFLGRVVDITGSAYTPGKPCATAARGKQCGGKIVTLEVSESLKGTARGKVRVLAQDGCYCLGGYFERDKSYVISGKANSTTFKADYLANNICAGTVAADAPQAQELLAWSRSANAATPPKAP